MKTVEATVLGGLWASEGRGMPAYLRCLRR